MRVYHAVGFVLALFVVAVVAVLALAGCVTSQPVNRVEVPVKRPVAAAAPGSGDWDAPSEPEVEREPPAYLTSPATALALKSRCGVDKVPRSQADWKVLNEPKWFCASNELSRQCVEQRQPGDVCPIPPPLLPVYPSAMQRIRFR